MNKSQIDRYFKVLAKLYPKECRIILTGAVAGVLYGRIRPTMDIDFSVRTGQWDDFSKVVEEARLRTGIVAQYAEDIDRWSAITLMDYEKHTYLYRRFGSIEIRLMEPPYWAIGKLSRYLDTDIQDLVKVFKKTNTHWRDVSSVAGEALRKSPKSTACSQFRRQVEDFLKNQGRKVWKQRFTFEEAIILFHKHAGIRQTIAKI